MVELMSMFKKKSWIRFYSIEPAVVDLFPIIHSSQLKRPWMSETKKSKCPFASLIKYPDSENCPGIRGICNTGYIVTAPADFVITTNGDGVSFDWSCSYLFSKGSEGQRSYISSHNEEQVSPLVSDNNTLKTVIKVETPWRLKSSNDVVFLQMPVQYTNETRFTAATGVFDPKYAHVINIQLFWHVLNGETFIKAGTPLVQYVPVSRQYLTNSKYEFIMNDANSKELQIENSFNYANTCNMLERDNLNSRISRAMTVFNKYNFRRN